MRNYKEIHETLIREEKKISCLESFINKAERYKNNLDNIKYLRIFYVRRHVQNRSSRHLFI